MDRARTVHLDPVDSQPWTDHREDIQRRTGDPPVIDTVLRSGDALYLPRGWVHSARALGTTSIHLTIGTAALTALDVLGAMVEQLTELRELRESLPMGIDLTDPDATAALVGKTLAAALEAVRDRSTEIESGPPRYSPTGTPIAPGRRRYVPSRRWRRCRTRHRWERCSGDRGWPQWWSRSPAASSSASRIGQ